MRKLPWYKEGLKFECTGCGKCCTGRGGYVWTNSEEIKKMAVLLGISVKEFKCRYVRSRDNRLALNEKKNAEGNFDCVFLEGKRCKVYQERPIQCQTFPWWEENLKSEESWALAALDCEGMDENASLVSFEEIKKQLHRPD